MSINFDPYGGQVSKESFRSNKGAAEKFVRPRKRKANPATDNPLEVAREKLDVGAIGREANRARLEGRAPSLTQTRQETQGTVEQFMAVWDRDHPGYGEPTGGFGKAKDDPVRKAVRDKAESLVDPNTGTIPPGYADGLKRKLQKAKSEGRILGPDDIGKDPNDSLGDDLTIGVADTAKAMAEIPGALASEAVSGPIREGLGAEHPVTKFAEQTGGIAPYLTPLGAPLMVGQAAESLAEGGPEQMIKSFVPVDQVTTLLDTTQNPGTRAGAAANLILLALGAKHALRSGAKVLGEVGDHVRAVSEKFGPDVAKVVQSEIESPTFDREAFTKQLQSQEGAEAIPLVNIDGDGKPVKSTNAAQAQNTEVRTGPEPDPNIRNADALPGKRATDEGRSGSIPGDHEGQSDPALRSRQGRSTETVTNLPVKASTTAELSTPPVQTETPKSTLRIGRRSQSVPPEEGARPAQPESTAREVLPHETYVEVNGRRIALSGDVKAKYDQLKADHDAHLKEIDRMQKAGTIFADEAASMRKSAGMQHSAQVRELTGSLTAKEQAAADAQTKKITMGREVVTVDGRTGIVDSNPAFGKVRVKFPDGHTESIPHSELQVKNPSGKTYEGVRELPQKVTSTNELREQEPPVDSGNRSEDAGGVTRGSAPRIDDQHITANNGTPGATEGIAHADTAKERSANGLDPYVKTKYKVTEYSQEAIDRGHRDNALVIADEVNSGKKTSGDRWEQEGLRLAKHDANVARSQAQLDKGAAVDSGDAAAMLDASIRETTATANHDKISKALDKIGTEAGGTLGARALDLVSEGDALSLRKKIQSETGTKVSDADQARLDNHAKIVTDLEKRVADLEAHASELAAKRAVSRGAPRSISRAGRVTDEQFKEAVKTLGTVVKTGQAGSGLGGVDIRWTDAHQEALRVVVRKIVQEGAATLEAVHAKVKETFGKEIAKDKVNQAIVDEMGRPRDVPPEVLKERAKLNAEKRKTRQTMNQIISDAKWAQKTTAQKGLTHVADALSVPRRLMTFLDDSAIGRQGLFLGLTHPKAAGRAFVRHWEALKRDGFDSVMGRLEHDPDFDLFKGTGGYFSDPRSGLHEEGFLNSTLDKIPGLNKLMSKSEDLMSAYLNELRLESFKALKGGLEIGGHKATVKELRWAADMVNVASGRGAQAFGGTLDKAASQVFFSPQMLVSRLKMATGVPIAKGFAASPRAGGLATAEYAKYVLARGVLDTLLTGGVVSAVQAKNGVEEEKRFKGFGGRSTFDVHDKEFGNVRFGKLKTDVSGGQDASMAVIYKNLARLAENASNLAQKKPLTKAPYGQGPVEDLEQFAGRRLAPVPSYIGGFGSGKDFKGDEFKPGWEAVGLVTPIHASSTVEAAHNDKASPGEIAKMAALEIFGFGTSYYEKKPMTRASRKTAPPQKSPD